MSKKSLIILLIILIVIVGALLMLPKEDVPVDDNGPVLNDEINDEIPEMMTVSLYFVRVVDGQEEIEAVAREIPATEAVGRAAIQELLAGPLPQEEAEGLSTVINEGTELQSLHIDDGVAWADFNQRLQEGVAGSAWVMAIRSQIEQTLSQFETVDEVIISIDGETEEILQP